MRGNYRKSHTYTWKLKAPFFNFSREEK